MTPNFKNQIQMFNYIWETREHISQLSGKPLLNKSHPQWHWQFLHVLPKGSYPYFKFNPENILLGLPEEHEKQTSFKIFTDKSDELKREYYKIYYGKTFDM
jgi:hypothetical protein